MQRRHINETEYPEEHVGGIVPLILPRFCLHAPLRNSSLGVGDVERPPRAFRLLSIHDSSRVSSRVIYSASGKLVNETM